MPIPVQSPLRRADVPELPILRRSTVQACRFSCWYPLYRRRSIRGDVYKFNAKEEAAFRAWFDEDGMRLPEGVAAEDESQLSDSDSELVASSSSSRSSSDVSPPPQHSFPALTELVNQLLGTHRPLGLFPKLNTTAPQDAQWILPLPQPLKCSTAEDVFMVLKASGLMNGILEGSLFAGRPAEERGDVAQEADLESERGEISIDGVVEDLSEAELEGERIELVLKKWYDMDRSREFRLFIRGDVLLGISQRDTNHYPHMLAADIQSKVRNALSRFFDETVRFKFPGGADFVVDVYLNSALDAAHIIDISPFHPFQTAGILFDYSELHELYLTAVTSTDPTTGDEQEGEGEVIDLSPDALPVLRIIESRMHPAAARNSPAYPAYPADVNMVGGGRDIEEFKRVWEQEVAKAAVDGDT